jgi:hypothetical protein
MEWRCRECGEAYDEPPETCACGSPDVEPDEGAGDSRFSLLALRRRLLEPDRADRSLVRDEPYVTLVFRVLFACVVVGTLLIAIALLV